MYGTGDSSGNFEAEISNWSITLYNNTATVNSIMGIVDLFDGPLEDVYDADGDTVAIPDGKIIDLGDSLNFVNGTINTGNSYIQAGNKKIEGSNIHFGNDGKIRLTDGNTAKVTETDLVEGTTVQGFIVGKNAPGLERLVLSITGTANATDYTGATITQEFDFTGSEILGLVNYSFTVNDIPEGLTLEVKND